MIRESITRVNLNEAFQLEFNTAVLGLSLLEQMNTDDINEGVNDILAKFGFELEKKSPGVIEYLARFTKGVGKFVWYAIKRDKKGIKALMKDFSKEELVDFLYKLDLVTMHLITGPLHFIDGMTGWELIPKFKEMKASAETAISKIKKAIENLKSNITNYFNPKLQPVVLDKVVDIEKLL